MLKFGKFQKVVFLKGHKGFFGFEKCSPKLVPKGLSHQKSLPFEPKTRTSIVHSNRKYSFFQIHLMLNQIQFIKSPLSNKFTLTNTLYKIHFIKYPLPLLDDAIA